MHLVQNSRRGLLGAALVMLLAVCGASTAAQANNSADQTAANKKLVVDFFKMVFHDKKPREAFAKYASKDYIQHNPLAADGPEPAIKFLTEWFEKNPNAIVEIKRVIAEGDVVAIHHHMRRSPEERGMAAVDMFRVENGKVIEHWDVVQPMPEKSLNPHPMF